MAAAQKQARGVARGVGQIVFAGSWHYSLEIKTKPRDLQMRYLVCKMIRARLRIQRAFVLSGIEWIYQNGRVWIEGNG